MNCKELDQVLSNLATVKYLIRLEAHHIIPSLAEEL